MIRSTLGVIVTLAVVMTGGCQQEAMPPSDGTPAEVPGPGPAADPGPAPDGQWEPPVEDNVPIESPATGADTTEGPFLPSATEDVDAPAADNDEAVSLTIQPWEETEQLIAAHRGKVVVVDFWSTSCLPCRREFPHFVDLHNAHRGEIACISISLDYSGRAGRPPESYRERVHKFLAEQGATFANVLSSDDPDKLQSRLKLAPIPLVWVYDREGNLTRQFDNSDPDGGEFTYANDVLPFVETLLADN